jgi:hypothetical protein
LKKLGENTVSPQGLCFSQYHWGGGRGNIKKMRREKKRNREEQKKMKKVREMEIKRAKYKQNSTGVS